MPDAEVSLSVLQGKFPAITLRSSADHPAFNIPASEARSLLQSLRAEFGYELLMDLTAIDWSENASPRFTVVYHLFSLTAHNYIRVAADCPNDAEPVMPSIIDLWPAADWHERECYDMFGIRFENHPDLRRILMWEGYPYHPLRKEFPLAGIEVPLPDEEIGKFTGASVLPAPLAGGPFVASTGELNLTEAEPRAKDESWSDRRPRPDQPGLKQVKS